MFILEERFVDHKFLDSTVSGGGKPPPPTRTPMERGCKRRSVICKHISDVICLLMTAKVTGTRRENLSLSFRPVRNVFPNELFFKNHEWRRFSTTMFNFSFQGCVKVWDIEQVSGKTPISTLECLVSDEASTLNICMM